jgi:hypothetical protein
VQLVAGNFPWPEVPTPITSPDLPTQIDLPLERDTVVAIALPVLQIELDAANGDLVLTRGPGLLLIV